MRNIPRWKLFLVSSFWLVVPLLLVKGDLLDKIAAMLTDASTQLKKAPYSINFPRKTSSGNLASRFPSDVNTSPPVSAFTVLRDSIALRTFFAEGGSRASESVSSISPRLQILTRSMRSCKERRSISGLCCSAIYSNPLAKKNTKAARATKYHVVMSIFCKQVKAQSLLNSTGSTSTLLSISTGYEAFHKLRYLTTLIEPGIHC